MEPSKVERSTPNEKFRRHKYFSQSIDSKANPKQLFFRKKIPPVKLSIKMNQLLPDTLLQPFPKLELTSNNSKDISPLLMKEDEFIKLEGSVNNFIRNLESIASLSLKFKYEFK